MGSITVPVPPCGTEACAEVLESLAVAAEHRDMIGMAKGLIMVRSSCSPEAAFDVLRRASMRENIKVFDIASRMIESASVGSDRAEFHLTQ